MNRVAYSQETHLRLATTTSTENTGLLNVLLPPFEKKNNCKVDVISVGTGKALKLGERGDVDVVLVHARKAEDKFVADGFGVDRRDVMHNDFIIVGPENDPAGVKGEKDAAAAFKKIADKGAPFVSRGDESGTHIKEKELWEAAGVAQKGPWYMEAGQEMGATLIMANEKLAYALTDRGTFTAFKEKLQLKVLCEGDPRLYNPYGVIAVNPKKWPHVKYDLAKAFIEFITSEEGQAIIANFRKDGEQLFQPDAVKTPGTTPK
jgi:tungstate transport system substrate-binding protein